MSSIHLFHALCGAERAQRSYTALIILGLGLFLHPPYRCAFRRMLEPTKGAAPCRRGGVVARDASLGYPGHLSAG